MSAFKIPEFPDSLDRKQWERNKDITEALRTHKDCLQALNELARAWQQVDFARLNQFLSTTPTWQQYNGAKWTDQCDQLCRDIIVNGVMDLRESIKNAAILITKTADKIIEKRDPLARKSLDLARQLAKDADNLVKAFRPDSIETLIREKETQVQETMIEQASLPFEAIKKRIDKIKGAIAILSKTPNPIAYNKVLGHGTSGFIAELLQALRPLATLPAKGITYEGAATATTLAKDLASMKPLPDKASPADITRALKELITICSEASKLPKIKT